MTTERRDFLKTTAVLGGAMVLGLGSALSPGAAAAEASARGRARPAASRALRVLILGGTNITGPHTVRYAVERGHQVSIFTRGRRRPGLFAEAFEHVEHLIGDRAGDLDALRGRRWDVCIDASGSSPEWTRMSAELLRDAVDSYVYISSTGVFYPYRTTEIPEDGPIQMTDPSGGSDGSARFGVMKAQSEAEARKVFGERTLVIRPGYIVGPLDRTHRGTYWPERMRRGGEVLVPGRPGDLVQQIDARDLSEWWVRLMEDGVHGTFNATGPGYPLTMEAFIHGVRATSSADVTLTWVDDYAFLEEQDFTAAIPWILPVGDHVGSQRIDCSRARAAGLTYRPVAVTALDTLAWYHSDALTDADRSQPAMALAPEREAEILAVWRGRPRP